MRTLDLSLAALSCAALGQAALSAPPQSYVNTAIARTVELGGLTTLVTTQYNVKSTADGPGEYWLALAGEDDEVPAWWEVSVGGKKVDGVRLLDERPPTAAVSLGSLAKDESINLSLTHLLTHSSAPLPAEIEQREQQFLQWKSNTTYVPSWYPADVERIKIRSPHPTILSYSQIPDTYARDNTLTKSGGTLTLGPLHFVPATLGSSNVTQQPFSVHYESKDPVIGIRKLGRIAEVSHWGANLNIQDEVELVNMGPKLKGHFSRLHHQQSKFHASTPPQILTEFTYKLPPTAHTPYYYDTIGNVSTSHFRAGSTPRSAPSGKGRTSPRTVDGSLELRPRYPLLGGWNYTFTVGYDVPLADVLKVEEAKAGGRKVLAVPFLTALQDVVVDDAELKIVLPEGASDVQIYTPFPVDSIEHSTHKTYLDTTGRYAVTLRKARVTEKHAQDIYVTYHYPLSAQFQKPLAVSTLVGSLFLLGMALRRVNYSIDKKEVIVVE
ncbi:hypothetical protein IAU60_001670 [Kwoniella sp. DSM 27419]